MSAPHEYHQPNAPDSPNDSDSDLELDLQELDPATSSTHAVERSSPGKIRAGHSRGESDGDGIALKRLGAGGLRALRGYGRGKRRDLEEDTHGLLNTDNGDGGDSFRNLSTSSGEDDSPLLRRGRRRSSHNVEGTLSQIGSKLRLPGFGGSRINLDDVHPDEIDEEEREEHDPSANRTVLVGQIQPTRFPANAVSNAKYTPWSFLPVTLYNEFSFFFNLYFLLVALSQIIPALRIGVLSTYIAPLAFVLAITLGKEAADDIARRRRDTEANSEPYTVLRFDDPRDGLTGKKGKSKSRSALKSSKIRKRSNVTAGSRLDDIQEEEENLGSENALSGTPTTRVTEVTKRSRDLKVGDILKMGKDRRVPADVVILKSYPDESVVSMSNVVEPDDGTDENQPDLLDDAASGKVASKTINDQFRSGRGTDTAEPGGDTFIRTDQLDGETDWKLRLASPLTQSLDTSEYTRLTILAGKPEKKVNEFVGTVELGPKPSSGYDPHIDKTGDDDQANGHTSVPPSQNRSLPLTVDNTAWANTVLATSSTVLAVVVYTGPQTRQALSTSPSRSKTGLLEYEINALTKILCALTLFLSIILVALEAVEGTDNRKWYISVMRFLILFSTIVPISLRVNLDMGKTVYAWFIQHDIDISGTVVRTSTIPEELGRVEYLLSDKTGTLTQNDMELKKIHVGTVSYANEAMEEVSAYVRQGFSAAQTSDNGEGNSLVTPSTTFTGGPIGTGAATRTRREIGSRVRDVVLALALCHNVTPTTEEHNGEVVTTYQASSPDEVAIVKWTGNVGLRLIQRDRKSIVLESVHSGKVAVRVKILDIFPFTSEGKRMGIIVQFFSGAEDSETSIESDGEIWFYQKGADTVMTAIVAANDWLDEETANMAREGLRTLVVGRRKLSAQQYHEFSSAYSEASLALHSRDAGMAKVVKEHLESDLELLGVTGVEDKLQRDVKPSLELLRNAGIKIWMLTGDKVETARCVAVSAKLVARGQYVHTISKLKRKDLARDHLDFLRNKPDACLLIDGDSLSLLLSQFRHEFISLAVLLPAVIACRCSPTQKAEIAQLIRTFTKKRICCIGDGGNDVSMIQAADVGVGIVGKEGRQASLAADFSIEQFCYLTKLLVWHGRNSYKRSAKLAQFVIHRGLIISVCQTVFSIASKFEPNALYKDWLLVGYATVYTMFPVFSLVLDTDIPPQLSHLYPELYAELAGRSGQSPPLSYRTFFVWVFISLYQGICIQLLSQFLAPSTSTPPPAGTPEPKMLSLSFTALIFVELGMVSLSITTLHWVMLVCIVATAGIYLGSVPFLGDYYDLHFLWSVGFLWRVITIWSVALGPVAVGKWVRRVWKPPSYRKVQSL